MTAHRIRIAINAEGILCSVCDQPVKWVRSEYERGYLNCPAGEWQHVEPDSVALAASMARHPSGKGKKK